MITAKIESRSLVKSLLIWSLFFGIIVFGFSSVYPQMHNTAMKSLLDAKLGGLSPALLKTFNISVNGQSSFLVATGFFSYYFQYMFLAASIYAMMLGSQSLIKEETDGTIEFLYAQPITRKGIVSGKLLANTAVLILFWFISFVFSISATLLFKQSSDKTNDIITTMTKIFLQDGLILLFFLMLGFLLSTFLKSSKQSNSVSLAVVFSFYLLGIFSDLNQSFEWAQNFSPIHMGIPANLIEKSLTIVEIGGLTLFILFFAAVTYTIYQRKDLKI